MGNLYPSGDLPDWAGSEPNLGFRREVLFSLEGKERRRVLVAALQREVMRALGKAPARSPHDVPLTALGLDSLAAIQLQHTIAEHFGAQLSLASLLEGASVDDVAGSILERLDASHSDTGLIHRGAREVFSLTPNQKALWFLERMVPSSAAYHISAAARVGGDLDAGALRRAFQDLVDRHPALRTTIFERNGSLQQRVHSAMELAFAEEDGSEWSATKLEQRITEEAERGFDFSRGPLLRLALFRTAIEEAVLVLTVHHLVADFWSLALLMRQAEDLYREHTGGEPAAVPSPELTYADFAEWQAARLRGEEGDRLRRYWSERLAGDPPPVELPTDRPRPAFQSFAGAAVDRRFAPGLLERLESQGRARGATLFATLLAAFQVLLHRVTAQDDLVLGSPALNRERPETRDIFGYLVNPVVLRSRLVGRPTFENWLGRIRGSIAGALEHQALPFPLVVELLGKERDPSRSPVFQCM